MPSVLPSLPGFSIEAVQTIDTVLLVVAHSQAKSALCPTCGTLSQHIHSQYQRTLADLPCSGQRLRLSLLVSRFFCKRVTCPRKTFAERLPAFAPLYARRTVPLLQVHSQVALALGGEAGARLTRHLALPCSAATLLRSLRHLSLPPVLAPRIIGIDDWAWRKGQRYGTLICDLQSHRPLDLLPDRTASSAAQWLKGYPSSEIISRDRGGTYAEAARIGAPQAIQVADRWHLLNNLGDALELLLTRHLTLHHTQVTQQIEALPLPSSQNRAPFSVVDPQKGEQRRQARLARYEQVIALAKQGMTPYHIVLKVGLDVKTIQHWIAAGQFPERQPRFAFPRPTPPWLPYALQRWQEGKRSILAIYRELQAQGYQGSYWSVYSYLSSLRKAAQTLPLTVPVVLPSARQARLIFLQRPIDLTEEQQSALYQLFEQDPVLKEVYHLIQRFTSMVRTLTAEPLQGWLDEVEASSFKELLTFVRGVRRDLAAVVAGLSLPWSQGQTEGQITRLKLIKRQMYGRAHFDLLRRRVLSKAEYV